MRKISQREPLREELSVAIGLVWGHLNTAQFDQAFQLARGCLRVWPSATPLQLMAAFAAVELGVPLTPAERSVLENAACVEWSAMILCRADGVPADSGDVPR